MIKCWKFLCSAKKSLARSIKISFLPDGTLARLSHNKSVSAINRELLHLWNNWTIVWQIMPFLQLNPWRNGGNNICMSLQRPHSSIIRLEGSNLSKLFQQWVASQYLNVWYRISLWASEYKADDQQVGRCTPICTFTYKVKRRVTIKECCWSLLPSWQYSVR